MLHYVEGMIDALKKISYTKLNKKQLNIYLKQKESLERIKVDLVQLNAEYTNQTELAKMWKFDLHNENASKIVEEKIKDSEEKVKAIEKRIKDICFSNKTIPTSIGIKKSKEEGIVSLRFKDEIEEERNLKRYGFKLWYHDGKYAIANMSLFAELFETYSKKEENKRYEKNREFERELKLQEANKIKKIISDNEYFFGDSFDSKSAIRENPGKIHILKELSEINEEMFCLELEIPEVIYKNATPQELKKIEKYKKAINKKKEALLKIKQQTMRLIEPRRNKADIQLAIEHLNADSKIPQETKEQLLKTLKAQLIKEEKKEAKIKKQIERQRRKSKIEQYNKNKYKVYSNMAKMQRDYELSDVESANEKTFLEEDIKILNRKLENESLSKEERDELQNQLKEKTIKLNKMGTNSLDSSERRVCKEEIISFWKQIVEREVFRRKKTEPLLLTDGQSAQVQSRSKRDELIYSIKFRPDPVVTIPERKEDMGLQQEGKEPAED